MIAPRIRRIALALCASASLLTGCGGSGGSGATVNGGGPLPPPGSRVGSSGFTYDTQMLAKAQFVGPAQFHTLGIDIIPRLQNANGLLDYARQVSDPHSGMYRRFLTPREIGDRFGASTADYSAAKTYFKSHNLAVSGWPQRLLLHVSGTQSDLETAFGTHFGWYKNAKGTFLAPMQAPSVPVTVPVIGSVNIVHSITSFNNSVKVQPAQYDGTLYGYTPQQIAAAFDYTGAYRAGYTGAGVTVGIIGTGGFSPADVPAYKAVFHVPGTGSATMVAATDDDSPGNGAIGFAPPPPVTGPCMGNPVFPRPDCNPEDGETQIDTEQVAGLAYDSGIRYYLAYNPNDACGAVGATCPPDAGIPLQGLGEIDAELQTAIADNAADVISVSFGGPEPAMVGGPFNASGNGLEPLEYAALASEGIAIFASSGDSGAEQCLNPYYDPAADDLCVSYPSSDPNVVSVGGTNTPLNSAARLVGPITGWGATNTGGAGGSGGGVSAYFQQSPFQRGASGVNGSMRNTPDISLNADAKSGVATLMYGDPKLSAQPQVLPFGGTSVAAPEAAAMWALVLQACSEKSSCRTATGAHPYRMGNPAHYFYEIYADQNTYSTVFYDVLWGNNAQLSTCAMWGPTPPPDDTATPGPCPSFDPGYPAQTGYDRITGIGVPYARALITAVVGE